MSWLFLVTGCWLSMATPSGPVRAKADLERQPRPIPILAARANIKDRSPLEGRPRSSPSGVQIVADGAGKFTVIVYLGGLPGAGWKPGDVSWRAEGKTEDDRTDFHSDRLRAVLDAMES